MTFDPDALATLLCAESDRLAREAARARRARSPWGELLGTVPFPSGAGIESRPVEEPEPDTGELESVLLQQDRADEWTKVPDAPVEMPAAQLGRMR